MTTCEGGAAQRVAALLMICLVVSGAAAAQTPPDPVAGSGAVGRYVDPVVGVSLAEAIAQALRREPALAAARQDIEVARGERLQAGLRPNPTVSLTRQEQMGGADNQSGAGVELPLDLFRRAGRLAAADRAIDVARHGVADRERLLAADIRAQFGQLLAAVRRLEVTEEILSVNRRSLELLHARVAEGATPPLERDLVSVDVQRFEAERPLIVAQADMASIELKRLLGLPPDAPLKVKESLEMMVQGMTVRGGEGAIAGAWAAPGADEVDRRPDVREAEARVALADARIDRARREGRFDVGLFASYMRMNSGFPQRGFGADGGLEPVHGVSHNVSAGVAIMMPVRNRNQGMIAAARAERTAAERLREARRVAAAADIASARVRFEQARSAVDLYAGGVRPLARRNFDVVRETYTLGRATLFDALNEQRRYLEVETAYTDALLEAFDAKAALERALGETQ